MRIDNDDDLDKAKEDLKLQLIKMRDLKDERNEKDFERKREDIRIQLEKHEKGTKDKVEEEKVRIAKQHEIEWESERAKYMKMENEKSETYQAIIKEIQMAKQKIRDLNSKEQKLQKDNSTR